MAKQSRARRQGDDYQARIFWQYALQLRTSDFVESVFFEKDDISFVDDVTVTYKEPIKEETTGKSIKRSFFQCKYHVTQGGAFTYENLLDPKFIHSKSESMLKRLYKAYQSLFQETDSFLLYIVSNWVWDYRDEIAKHLSEGLIRDTFYAGGPKSQRANIRATFANHLSISEQELRNFLDTVRFDLGKGLVDIAQGLGPLLKLADLKPVDPRTSTNIYDDLVWKLYQQGRNYFDSSTFNQMVHEEKLILPGSTEQSEISICSCPQFARRPLDVQNCYLDLTRFFDGRFPKHGSCWNNEIPQSVASFILSEDVVNLRPPIHLFFDCHLSIAFLAGNLLKPSYGLQIIPVQKSISSGYEPWPVPNTTRQGLWELKRPRKIETTELVLAISVTHPIENHLMPFLKTTGLDSLPRIFLAPANGTGPNAISDGTHAWQLGFELQALLRNSLPSICHTVHLFYSGPVALAFILGYTLRYITPKIQLYEHDYEGSKGDFRYYPSISIPFAS